MPPLRSRRPTADRCGGASHGRPPASSCRLLNHQRCTDPQRRKIFAADHLGLTIPQIRELENQGVFYDINNTTPISRSYSMFVMLVNFIKEKQAIDVQLR